MTEIALKQGSQSELTIDGSDVHNAELGHLHQSADAMRRLGNLGLQQVLKTSGTFLDMYKAMGVPARFTALPEAHNRALTEMSEFASGNFDKPEFGLDKTTINGKEVAINEEIVDGQDLPFGSLLHFKRDFEDADDRDDPPVLIVAPMSGHYATLLRDTARQMLPSHDVYITDWKDASNVPANEGQFGLDDYISYVESFIKNIGPDTNIIAVCQATVPVLAAVSHLAESDPSSQPRSMALMGGPLDTQAAPTVVTEFAQKHPIEWFQKTVVTKAPNGRLIYSGKQQVASFMGMNLPTHMHKFKDIYDNLREGNDDQAKRGLDFYREYFSSCDIAGKFYLETVNKIFKENQLANDNFYYKGNRIDPSKINRTAVYTIEGEDDDISAPGQTVAVHDWMTGINSDRHRNLLQEGVGHYGLFSGSTWRQNIAPSIADFIRRTAAKEGKTYNPR